MASYPTARKDTHLDYGILSEAVASLTRLSNLRSLARSAQLAARRVELDTITLYKSAGFSNLEIRTIIGIGKVQP